jgi:hypothetical protein
MSEIGKTTSKLFIPIGIIVFVSKFVILFLVIPLSAVELVGILLPYL